MSQVARARTSARQYLPESKLDDLASSLRRLANHRGLIRSEIASPMLLRLLPPPRRVEEKKYEADLRQRLTDANLDGPRIAYLMADAEREIAIAHTRLSG
ncbi:MAG: hypothetical protein ACAH20_15530 [Methylobacteriaceae bacterium]|jgi:hypothetical protein|uniref:Uncharacterized protein n=5 Tax=Methylorubrum extorquens TaxID=408 RepID=C5B2J8_METEA|nr:MULTISPECIES: hypothetical protein [Methylobacteriaceae]KQO78473.1 hypothetical protein ASF36_11440 [Methylobacterium sp. Leaf90]KQO89043.1 hypothetical protein ASF33_20795 [Methylobacterium sp. Leaf92]KQP89126.1 hypothetical protein ASF55_03320 [Methylobacterium sp. Leaf119]KQQ00391.1 hypothetical protein ASF59_04050 [Methylobacterium sp. Leaf121]MBA9069231.1 hypothetical protein [Methylobacterium sp. RAS18]MDF9865698.1 hypothetical protein [Methylorubrum pseudosasae]MDH6639260.1 hypothe